jgi:hypothetical protein
VLAVVFRRFQGVASQGVASQGPGGFRLTRLLQIIAGELWLAGCFKGCFVGGSVREVCVGSEDILFKRGAGRCESKGNRPCVLRKEKRAQAGSRNSQKKI